MKNLAQITGFPMLPPFYSIGFHYSKWEETSAKHIMDLNKDFEQHGFPLDVLWMDIGSTDDNKYFTFNPENFPENQLIQMHRQIEQSERRLVVITDPHIKWEDDGAYFVKQRALEIEAENYDANIFVR